MNRTSPPARGVDHRPGPGEVWEFDIGVSTHDLLRAGVVVHHYRRVAVAADDVDEAALLACQLAAHPTGVMPTECLLRL